MLSVAIPFDSNFAPAAIRMMNWSLELSGRIACPCSLVVCRDTPQNIIDEAVAVAAQAFGTPTIVKPKTNDLHKWPDTVNLLFRTCAAYSASVNQPFFWMEVDCVPLTPDWFSRLEAGYENCKKPYMGFRRDVPVPHISGPAIYPAHVNRYNPHSLVDRKAKSGDVIPFDVVEGHLTLKYAHVTDLIQHRWGTAENPPTFPDKKSLGELSKRAVIYHRVKDGTLIDRLRERYATSPIAIKSKSVSGLLFGDSKDDPKPSVALVYVYVPGDTLHRSYATRFVTTYLNHKPLYDHRTIVVCQSKPVDRFGMSMFSRMPNVKFYQHDDSGWDIGAFIAVSKINPKDIQVNFGGSSYFQREGWLARMVEAWTKHGPGFYGVTGTYEVSPHLNTSGFFCPPKLLASYPIVVKDKLTRYDFEHGPNAAWKIFSKRGSKVKLVTWCGEYDWQDWRKPPNIFRRGDQSNALACWHHFDRYRKANPETKKMMESHSDTITDPEFLNSGGIKNSILHFLEQHKKNNIITNPQQKLAYERSADGVK